MLGGIFGQGALLIPVLSFVLAWCVFRGPDLVKRNNRVTLGSLILLIATSLFFARHAGTRPLRTVSRPYGPEAASRE